MPRRVFTPGLGVYCRTKPNRFGTRRLTTMVDHLISDAMADAFDITIRREPVDMGALAEGEIRRTRAAQVAAAFWKSGPEEITLVSFRSVAGYVIGLLEVSSRKGGELFAV